MLDSHTTPPHLLTPPSLSKHSKRQIHLSHIPLPHPPLLRIQIPPTLLPLLLFLFRLPLLLLFTFLALTAVTGVAGFGGVAVVFVVVVVELGYGRGLGAGFTLFVG